MNTSPFSIYILIGMIYEKYRVEYFTAYIDSGAGICTVKRGVFPFGIEEELPEVKGRNFSKKNNIFKRGIKEAKIMIGGAGDTPWYKVKTPPLHFHETRDDILRKQFPTDFQTAHTRKADKKTYFHNSM